MVGLFSLFFPPPLPDCVRIRRPNEELQYFLIFIRFWGNNKDLLVGSFYQYNIYQNIGGIHLDLVVNTDCDGWRILRNLKEYRISQERG